MSKGRREERRGGRKDERKKKGGREGKRGIGQRERRTKRNHFFNSHMLLALHQVYKDITQFCR